MPCMKLRPVTYEDFSENPEIPSLTQTAPNALRLRDLNDKDFKTLANNGKPTGPLTTGGVFNPEHSALTREGNQMSGSVWRSKKNLQLNCQICGRKSRSQNIGTANAYVLCKALTLKATTCLAFPPESGGKAKAIADRSPGLSFLLLRALGWGYLRDHIALSRPSVANVRLFSRGNKKQKVTSDGAHGASVLPPVAL